MSFLESIKKNKDAEKIKEEISKATSHDCLEYVKDPGRYKSGNDKNDEEYLEAVYERINDIMLTTKDAEERGILSDYYLGTNRDLKRAFRSSCSTVQKDLKPSQIDDGVSLWKCGYDVIKFLGEGAFGTVWEIKTKNGTNKAAKLISDRQNYDAEIIPIKELSKLMNSEKAIKYLNLPSTQKDSQLVKPLLSLLAEGDLRRLSKKNKKNGKTIASILRKCRQTLKAVKFLHDNGYSHNDIKPDNFLKINKSNFEKAEKQIEQAQEKDTSKGNKKNHKYRIQLADFGLMSKIHPDPGEKQTIIGTKGYMAPDTNNLDPRAVEKRDVYSLGVTFMFFTVGHRKDEVEASEFLVKNDVDKFYDQYLESMSDYGGTSKENKKKFLEVIKKMLEKNFQQRLSIDEAITQIQSLKSE